MELLREDAQIKAGVRQAERQEMLRPAPKDFRPEGQGRKVRLTLVPRDKTIHVKQTFWYRLELQNVGSEPVEFREHFSFFKDGFRYEDGKLDFFVTEPGGKRHLMSLGNFADEMMLGSRPGRAIEIPGAEKMTKEEIRVYMRRDSTRRKEERALDVTLAPGETLVSRPWRWVTLTEEWERYKRGEKELWPKPAGTFRELWTEYIFKKPGRYSIEVEYLDKVRPPDEWLLKAMEKKGHSRDSTLRLFEGMAGKSLGTVRSDAVALEVLP